MFKIRTVKPTKGNKYFIRSVNGGYNTCIQGYPTDPYCNVLANCVGYAEGRFNEICNELSGKTYPYKNLNCNAENFIKRVKDLNMDLEIGYDISKPRAGAIVVMAKGKVGNSSDGAGHVFIIEKVNADGSIYTSESGYGSTAFWNATRKNTNGKWGLSSSYSFVGYIYNPYVKEEEPVDPFPGVSDEELAARVWAGEFGNGDERKEALGIRYDAVQALVDQGVGKPEPTPEPIPPKPEPEKLKVGDKVQIIGAGNGSSHGTANTAYGIGWTRQILKIWDGRKYPYQVGNNTGTTGFYKAEALKKK